MEKQSAYVVCTNKHRCYKSGRVQKQVGRITHASKNRYKTYKRNDALHGSTCVEQYKNKDEENKHQVHVVTASRWGRVGGGVCWGRRAGLGSA